MNAAMLMGMMGQPIVIGAPPPPLAPITFTTSTSWTCPAGVTLLPSVYGHGQDGYAPYTSTDSRFVLETYSYFVYDDGASFSGYSLVTQKDTTPEEEVPAEFCYPSNPYTVDGHFNRAVCYFSGKRTITTSVDHAGANGAGASAFSLSFPGGAENSAPAMSYSNVSVVPGTVYTITVPSGASITITF